MSLRHLVFADCATLTTDPRHRQIFTAMAYAMYPPGVIENKDGVLVVRRLVHDKCADKAARMKQAIDALAALGGVQAYNNRGEHVDTIHVDANQTVLWPARTHDILSTCVCPPTIDATPEWHLVVVPDLIEWTTWCHDHAWNTLRTSLTTTVPTAVTSKPMKTAMALDFVRDDNGHRRPAIRR